MCYEEETLWRHGRWAVVRNHRANGGIMIVDEETGYVEWPIWYGKYAIDGVYCGKDINEERLVAADFPERYPDYLLDVFRILQDEKSPLQELRLQLATMIAFIEQDVLPDDPKERALTWWCGSLPAQIWSYSPDEWWEAGNWSIEKVWDEILSDIKDAGLTDVHARVYELPIDDVLEVKSMLGLSKRKE